MTHYEIPGTVDINRGLVGYYKLDDLKSSSGTVAIDRVNFNDGIIAGPINTTGVNGLNADALLFDATDDLVNLGNDAGIDWNNDDFSISVWAELGVGPQALSGGIIGNRFGTGNSNWWTLGSRSPGDTIAIETQGAAAISSGFAPAGTGFHHYCLTKNDDNLILYIDGILSLTVSLAGKNVGTTTNDVYLGRWFSSNEIWDGAIGLVRIYDRILTSGEASKLHRLKL